MSLRLFFAAITSAALLACGSTAIVDGGGGSGGTSSSVTGQTSSASTSTSTSSGSCTSFVPCCDDGTGEEVPYGCENGMPVCPPGASFAEDTGICMPTSSCDAPGECGPEQWCDFPDDLCGLGAPGLCKPRPMECELIYDPRCTCAGDVAGNACDAQFNGQDVSGAGGCTPPLDTFACGPLFCPAGTSYCQRTVSDVPGEADGYDCVPVPQACMNDVSCSCLASEPCGGMCETLPGGEPMLTCPGG